MRAEQLRDAWSPVALVDWLAAATDHRPGDVDAPLRRAAGFSSDVLRGLWVDVQVLLRIVDVPSDRRFRVAPLESETSPGGRALLPPNVRLRPDERTLFDELALKVRVMNRNVLLRRATLLHTDVVRLVPEMAGAAGGSTAASAPLRVFVGDGSGRGAETLSLHEELARLVAGLIAPDPRQDAFVLAWYRATVLLWQATETFGSVQLRHAQRLFPDDAVVLYLAGCEHEAFASPLFQQFARSFRESSLRPQFGDDAGELKRAEDAYRRALAADASMLDASVRLGRVLGLRGRHDEAVVVLTHALDGTLDPFMTYYARLFRGAAHEALGQLTDARDDFEWAAAQVPHARVPHLSLAQLWRQLGDRDRSVASLSRALAPAGAKEPADPWVAYRRAQARNADAAMTAVVQMVAGGTP